MIELISAENPRFSDAVGTVTLSVQFSHLQHPVEFTASPEDSERHGREIHARALDGEFGPVAEYVPPTPAEVAARDNPPLRRQQMKLAAEQATHWDMMGDPTQAAAWRSHYQQLYVLNTAPGWPLVEQWPVAPTENER